MNLSEAYTRDTSTGSIHSLWLTHLTEPSLDMLSSTLGETEACGCGVRPRGLWHHRLVLRSCDKTKSSDSSSSSFYFHKQNRLQMWPTFSFFVIMQNSQSFSLSLTDTFSDMLFIFWKRGVHVSLPEHISLGDWRGQMCYKDFTGGPVRDFTEQKRGEKDSKIQIHFPERH